MTQQHPDTGPANQENGGQPPFPPHAGFDPAGQPPQFPGQQSMPAPGYGQPGTPPYPQYAGQAPMPHPAYGYGYPQPKSRLAAGLLGVFLGGLGIHRFYLGHTKIGVIQLVLTLVLGGFTFGLVALWGFIEGIMILAGASHFQRDAHGVPVR